MVNVPLVLQKITLYYEHINEPHSFLLQNVEFN